MHFSAGLWFARDPMTRSRKVAFFAVPAGLAVLALLLLWALWSTDGEEVRPGPVRVLADAPPDAGTTGAPLAVTRRIRSTGASADGGTADARDPNVHAKLGWGSGPNELGRDRPEEGNAEGPMSVAVDRQGRALVLDQVNGRIVRLDEKGEPAGTIPIPVQMAQDLAVTEDGKTLVMDRLVDRSVAILGPDGQLLGELPLAGTGIEEPGGVTGVFVDGEDVYVEREHGPLVRIGDTAGTPDTERPEIPGRPSRDGKLYLNAGLIDPLAGRVYLNAIARPSQEHLYTREYQLAVPLVGILALDTDLAGTIYLALLAEQPSGDPNVPPQHQVRLLCISPQDGTPIGQTELPATELPEESFRDFAVLDEGGVLYALRTEEGVVYQRADCR